MTSGAEGVQRFESSSGLLNPVLTSIAAVIHQLTFLSDGCNVLCRPAPHEMGTQRTPFCRFSPFTVLHLLHIWLCLLEESQPHIPQNSDITKFTLITRSSIWSCYICFLLCFSVQRSDPQLLAQFYYADEELNQVATELDSLDGRKDPQRCTLLVNQFRSCQVNHFISILITRYQSELH